MTWFRLPLFVWTHLRHQHHLPAGHAGAGDGAGSGRRRAVAAIGIFDPALGGDPLLFQHLFWFYSHPAVYIMILPGMGDRQRDHSLLCPQEHFRLHFVAFSSMAIAALGFLVWAHHMFVAGISIYAAMAFSV